MFDIINLGDNMDIHILREEITKDLEDDNLPVINQEIFDKLVDDCIECDSMESAWRIYFKYPIFKPDKIEDYFINKKSSHYIAELIDINEGSMNLDNFIDKIIASKDVNLIGEVALDNLIYKLLSDKHHEKLRKAAEELKNIV